MFLIFFLIFLLSLLASFRQYFQNRSRDIFLLSALLRLYLLLCLDIYVWLWFVITFYHLDSCIKWLDDFLLNCLVLVIFALSLLFYWLFLMLIFIVFFVFLLGIHYLECWCFWILFHGFIILPAWTKTKAKSLNFLRLFPIFIILVLIITSFLLLFFKLKRWNLIIIVIIILFFILFLNLCLSLQQFQSFLLFLSLFFSLLWFFHIV